MDLSLLSDLTMPVFFMVIGIALLIKGGQWTVDSAVYVARRFGLSPLIVGFTIVAFGTSLPEMVISVLANFEGSAGIALGNVIGSNIANVLLVIGLTATLVPLASTAPAIFRDVVMMMGATVLLGGLLYYGEISRLFGALMLLLLMGYVVFQYKMAKAGDLPMEAEDESEAAFSKPLVAYGFLILGLIGIAAGAEFLVRGAQESASIIGVPEAVIALSVIALGTSLPELSTCLIAARKGHSDIVLGNIIGSNVFNILMILGVTAVVKPIVPGSFAIQLAQFDIWIAGITSLVFAFLIVVFGKISRPAGFVFCAVYLVYNIYIYMMNMPS